MSGCACVRADVASLPHLPAVPPGHVRPCSHARPTEVARPHDRASTRRLMCTAAAWLEAIQGVRVSKGRWCVEHLWVAPACSPRSRPMVRHERRRSLHPQTARPCARLPKQAPPRSLPQLEDSPVRVSLAAPRDGRHRGSLRGVCRDACSVQPHLRVFTRAVQGLYAYAVAPVRSSRCPSKGPALVRGGVVSRPPRRVAVSRTTMPRPTVLNRLSPSHGPSRHAIVRCPARPPEG